MNGKLWPVIAILLSNVTIKGKIIAVDKNSTGAPIKKQSKLAPKAN